jgi:hypothetical protein
MGPILFCADFRSKSSAIAVPLTAGLTVIWQMKKTTVQLTLTGFCLEKGASVRPAILDINAVAE